MKLTNTNNPLGFIYYLKKRIEKGRLFKELLIVAKIKK